MFSLKSPFECCPEHLCEYQEEKCEGFIVKCLDGQFPIHPWCLMNTSFFRTMLKGRTNFGQNQERSGQKVATRASRSSTPQTPSVFIKATEPKEDNIINFGKFRKVAVRKIFDYLHGVDHDEIELSVGVEMIAWANCDGQVDLKSNTETRIFNQLVSQLKASKLISRELAAIWFYMNAIGKSTERVVNQDILIVDAEALYEVSLSLSRSRPDEKSDHLLNMKKLIMVHFKDKVDLYVWADKLYEESIENPPKSKRQKIEEGKTPRPLSLSQKMEHAPTNINELRKNIVQLRKQAVPNIGFRVTGATDFADIGTFIKSGTDGKVGWEFTKYDFGNNFNGHGFRAPVSGVFRFYVQVSIDSCNVETSILVNDISVADSDDKCENTRTCSNSVTLPLKKNDFVHVNIAADYDYQVNDTFFEGSLIKLIT